MCALSITNATYEIVSATDMMIPGSNWTSLASLYPAAAGTNLTSFVDIGGATNNAKFYKVAKTGISIALCDSNTFSGVVDIPVEIGMPSNQPLTGLYFLLDGQPSAAIAPPQFPLGGIGVSARFNTVIVSNGWHTMQAFAEYFSGNFSDSSGGYEEYASASGNVQVLNPISLDIPFSYGDDIGGSMTFPMHATLSTMTAQWTVAVNSLSNTLLKAYSGTTTNGESAHSPSIFVRDSFCLRPVARLCVATNRTWA